MFSREINAMHAMVTAAIKTRHQTSEKGSKLISRPKIPVKPHTKTIR
jgi:hypothetical protein